jgi:hypothetical protein
MEQPFWGSGLLRCALMHKRFAFVADNDGFDRILSRYQPPDALLPRSTDKE